jgi:5S rRNA maturation endonuclease (ribonuclease M5)
MNTSPSVQKYIDEHGLTTDFLKEQGVTWTKDSIDIPIKDPEGNILFIKSRNLNHTPENGEPKYRNSTGSHAALFNFHAVRDKPNIVLCEGEIDSLKLTMEGIPSVSSTGGSQTFPKEWQELLKDKQLWIAYDNDPAGKEGTRKLLETFPQAKAITLPVKDICEYFATGVTRKEFVGLVNTAQTRQEWLVTNTPEDYALMSVKDYEDLEVATKPWLIDGVLYSEGFCFIYGVEGSGKSLITLSMAQAVACGTPWLDHFPTTKANVLFLDKENPQSIIKRRIAGFGITSKENNNMFWLKYPEKFQIGSEKGGYSDFALALVNTIANKKIGLIVFDSFIDFMVGNESTSGDTQRFFDAIKELYPQVAYLTIQHENKPSQGLFRSDSQRVRGSSNINAQAITMFRLEPVAKSHTELTLKQTKARDTEKLDKFMIRMNIKMDKDEKTAVSGFTYLGICEEQEGEDRGTETENLIMEMLNANGFHSVSRKEVLEMTKAKGITERTVDRTIKELVEDKIINRVLKGRESWYVLIKPIVMKSPEEVFDGGLL